MTRHKRAAIGLLIFGAVVPTAAPAAAQTAAYDSTKLQVVLLGTGTPNADPERSGPAVAIVINGSAYIVDAGPGVVRRAAAAVGKGVTALRMPNLRRVFLTHLHSDHTLGLPDLMLSPWVLERSVPLEVYGPPGTRPLVEHLQAAYSEDTELRRNGLEPSNKTGHVAIPHEIQAGVVYRDENVTVTAIPADHGSWKHPFAYRFDGGGRSIVISGDTRETEAIVEGCNGCDVLVHEVYSDAGFAKRPPEWQRYHSVFHTPATGVGRLATRAKAKLVVLYHQLIWSSTEAALVEEVKSTYAGPVVSAHDLDIF